MLGLRPDFAFVAADETGSGPLARVSAVLVVEPDFAVVGLEEYGVPAGDVGLADEHDGGGGGGGGADQPEVVRRGAPDGDVIGSFPGSTEPCGQDISVFEAHEGGGVCGGERALRCRRTLFHFPLL